MHAYREGYKTADNSWEPPAMGKASSRIQVGAMMLLCATLLLGCGSKVTQENFAKIQSGMTEADVTAVLGPPTESNSIGFGPVGGTTSMWKDNGRIITIQFVNGKVLAKAFSGKTP
jgi:hypothetical protein